MLRVESEKGGTNPPENFNVLGAVIEATLDAVFVKDLEGRYLLVNSAFARFLDAPAEDIVGKLDRDLYPAETAERFVADDHEVLRTGETRVFEGVAQGPASTNAYRVTKGVLRDEHGRTIGIFGISHDITERRRAEEERLERVREQTARAEAEAAGRAKDELLAALRESEERYRSILENAHDIIYSHDLTGTYLSINRAGEEITGYTREDILGGMNIASVVAPEHLELARRMTAKKLHDPSPTVYEIDIITKDGRRLTVEVSTRIAYRNGEPVAVEGIARDVTERKRAEEERERLLQLEQSARREAERANRLKDEFLATLSHELRTPLTAIIGWLHLLMEGQLEAETARMALETVERNARAQVRLVNDLLDVSRIVTGKLRLELQPTALDKVIDSAVASVRPAAAAKGIRVLTALDPAASHVPADAERLQQVIWNLLSNAVKFTPEGGRVSVATRREGSYAEVEVCDTGRGIAPDFIRHVFDRFRQEDQSPTRAHGGLGLGLAIVRHLVELHGGTVRAESEGVGRGARFTVSLPFLGANGAAVRAEEGQEDLALAAPGARDESPSLEGLRVLVVDDEPDARELTAIVLRKRGAEVVESATARAALEEYGRTRFDVLVCDIGMPGDDGYWLINEVRELEKRGGRSVPAAALTAYARDEDRVKALLSGYQIHVSKPVSPAELVAVVANLAGRVVRS